MSSRNLTPLVGWHPSPANVAFLEAEIAARGGGRGVRSAILEEALTDYRAKIEAARLAAFKAELIEAAAALQPPRAVDNRSVECPYCHAAPGVHCRTMSGNLTGKYGTRVDHYRREVAARRASEEGGTNGKHAD